MRVVFFYFAGVSASVILGSTLLKSEMLKFDGQIKEKNCTLIISQSAKSQPSRHLKASFVILLSAAFLSTFGDRLGVHYHTE